ncbi:beta-lactamase-like protein [Mycena vulgaris]|nr:beta-lactamase-like protein [Mycena vulgaris]
MPPGAPYNSFVAPYRIRVDEFSTLVSQETVPALHLLSHTHSDHITGLQAKSFGYTVICSYDAKEMLLRHEVYAERSLHEHDYRAEVTRTYSHLKVDPLIYPDGSKYYTGSRDLLRPLPLNTPTEIELSNDESVTITLFDANHCPGAVMFLIEGAQGAILHTGDFRAEPWFLDSITRNPFLQSYLASPDSTPGDTLSKSLEAIYLDTASVMSSAAVPTKADATAGLVELMKLLPPTTYFFINSWTWGYEDVLKAVSRAFRSPVPVLLYPASPLKLLAQIHLDRYKHTIYSNISDPVLRALGTRDAAASRFHACERFDRCEYVAVTGRRASTSHSGARVVYVNPVTMDAARWRAYLQQTKLALARGDDVTNLLVPLSRHSPLPELQAFVALFRPRRVVPNTLVPALRGLDWRGIDRMFAGSVSAPPPAHAGAEAEDELDVTDALMEMETDSALLNLVGAEGAEKWVESATLRRQVAVIRGWLGVAEQRAVDQVMRPPAGVWQRGRQAVDSEDEESEADDERGRTAHLLFASLAGIEDGPMEWGHTASSSEPATPSSVGMGARAGGVFLTPVSSPVRARQDPAKDKGKKRLRESATPTATPTKRVRCALGSPFEDRQRPDASAWLAISSPPTPLQPVENTVAQASPSRLIVRAQTPPADPLGTRLHSMRSPAGGEYTFYELLPATSPAPPPSSPRPRARSPRAPPTLESVEAKRAALTRRLRLQDRLRVAHPERKIAPAYGAARAQLERRAFRLGVQAAFLAGRRESEAAAAARVRALETVYDEGEGSERGYKEDLELRAQIEDAARRGVQPVLPRLECLQSQSQSFG